MAVHSIEETKNGSAVLRTGVSWIALMTLAAATPAWAQDAASGSTEAASQEDTVSAEGDEEVIVVTGIRQSLKSARDRKRDSDTVMESVTALDIGAFPDKSVAEALQRIPGVTVNRFALSTDTAHFTAEPSGVIVRGLPQVRNEFNGRDTFSANSSRGLSWGDVPAELLGGVDVYKNQTADLIEGGIAGSVNLRTRVPFDAQGELIQVGVKMNYGDAAKEWSPDANVYYSNRWETGIGEIGLMGHVAYSHVKTASLGLQAYRAGIFTGGMIPGSEGLDNEDFGPGTVLAPSGGAWLDTLYDRKRIGVAGAAQWRSNDNRWLATAQYIRSNYTNEMREHGVGYSLFGVDANPHFRFAPGPGVVVPISAAAGTPAFTFDEDGWIDHGVFTVNGGWYGDPVDERGLGRNEDGDPMIHTCYAWATWAYPAGHCEGGLDIHAPKINTQNRYSQNKNMTQEAALNLKYEATDNLRLNFDAQYVDSKIELYDAAMAFGSFANIEMADLGTRPRLVAFHAPTNIDQSAGGLANPNNYWISSLADNVQDSEGNELALRADGEWDTPNAWFNTIRFGARFADRDQVVRNSAYNWNNISNTWTNGCQYTYFNLDSPPNDSCAGTNFQGYPAGFYEVSEFGNGFFGGNLGSFPFVPFEFFENRGLDLFSRERLSTPDPETGAGGVGSFIPVCERAAQVGTWVGNELPDSCFTPDEITSISEETRAAYVMVKFGDNDQFEANGVRLRGNVGLRYVETRVKSAGWQEFPTLSADPATACPPVALVPGGFIGNAPPPTPPPPGSPPQPPQAPYHPICYLSPDDQGFANGSDTGTPINVKATHRHWLPSLNLRFDFSDSWLLRFAASKAMSRPDIGLLKSYLNVSQSLPSQTFSEDLRDQWIFDAQGNPIGVSPRYLGQAFNPKLKPMTAWQYDLSLEHYFGNAGLFSFAIFHKTFQNYIQYSTFNAEVTNNGVTRTVEVTGPANGKGAKIQGFEVAYNRFFDFLPNPLNGLGIQTNYTYVKNKGIPNSNLQTVFPGNPAAGLVLDPGTLEGLSKHSFNVVGFYEKGPVSARLAYNWRSKYLITVKDCCVGLPVWQKEAGYLDASIRFNVNKNLELGLEGSNLLNTQTVTMQQVADADSPEGKRILTQNSWFRQDRRFTIGLRWKMGS